MAAVPSAVGLGVGLASHNSTSFLAVARARRVLAWISCCGCGAVPCSLVKSLWLRCGALQWGSAEGMGVDLVWQSSTRFLTVARVRRVLAWTSCCGCGAVPCSQLCRARRIYVLRWPSSGQPKDTHAWYLWLRRGGATATANIHSQQQHNVPEASGLATTGDDHDSDSKLTPLSPTHHWPGSGRLRKQP